MGEPVAPDGDDDRPLLRDSKLAPEQIEILNKAFDRALRALHLVDRGDPICEMVARTVIEVAKNGMLDPDAIAEETVRQLGLP